MNKTLVSILFVAMGALALGGCSPVSFSEEKEVKPPALATVASVEQLGGEVKALKSGQKKIEDALTAMKQPPADPAKVGCNCQPAPAAPAAPVAQVVKKPHGSPPRATPAPVVATATATAPAGGTARAEANASSSTTAPVTGGGAQACAWVHPGVAFDGSQTPLANKRFDKPATHTGSCIDFVNQMAKDHGFPTVRKIG